MPLVTISREFSDTQAQLKRARLEAAGFHPVITNEATALWLGNSVAADGIRVQVPEQESTEAKEFLKAPPPPAEPAQ